MTVRELNDNHMIGQIVVLVEANHYHVYNGMIGTVELDERRGFIFSPARRRKRSGRAFHSIPLEPTDLVEPF